MSFGVLQAASFAFEIKDPKVAAQTALVFLQTMKDDPAIAMMTKLINAIDIKAGKLPDTDN